MKYNTDWLLQKLKNKYHINYCFFWGHKASKDGATTKSCFSQWWPAAFTVDGIEYKTAEHWMMAKKALLFNDMAIHDAIIQADKPAVAKALGRKVKPFDAAVWDQHGYNLVVEGNYHKFSQHEALQQFLLATGDGIIVEASPVDYIWGIGMAQDNPNAMHPEKWKGRNLLGFALMEVRDKLREA